MEFPVLIRIDDQLVKKEGNGLAVMPIQLYEKRRGVRLDLDQLPFVYTGSRVGDTLLIQSLLAGSLRFDDLLLLVHIKANLL